MMAVTGRRRRRRRRVSIRPDRTYGDRDDGEEREGEREERVRRGSRCVLYEA
jgi:hypothetical protein